MKGFVNKPIRVIIVDDHEMVRAGLRALFGGFPQIRVMGEAATAAEAVEIVSIVPADVLLLDIRLPDGSGLEVCRKLQNSHPTLKVLFLTSYFNDHMVMDALSAGAEGYLLKEINAEVLVRSIEEIMEGKSVLDPTVTRRVVDSIRKGETLGNRAKLETLSPQEQKVIALVAEGLTNKEIAVVMKLSDKTVKNYLSKLMEKLQLKRRSQAAVFYAQATY